MSPQFERAREWMHDHSRTQTLGVPLPGGSYDVERISQAPQTPVRPGTLPLISQSGHHFLKRVIVTPAVYPRLVEFLHFDIQSTGQKSHCVNILWDHHNALF